MLSEPLLTAATMEAAGLLLRSPRWTVTEVLDLLDIGDAEFREMVLGNQGLANILERRKRLCYDVHERQCRACGKRFVRPHSATTAAHQPAGRWPESKRTERRRSPAQPHFHKHLQALLAG